MAQPVSHHSHQSHRAKHSHTFHSHWIVEFGEKADPVDNALDWAHRGTVQVAKSSALRAFRATVLESGIPHPKLNASGDLRGMVMSKRSRVIYNLSSNVAEKFDKYDSALSTAGAIIEIWKDAGKIHQAFRSSPSTGEKIRQTDLIVSTAILRSVTGVVPDVYHWLAKSLEGYCDIAGLVSGGRLPTEKWVGSLRASDVYIKTTHETLFSPEFVQVFGDSVADMISAHVHFN